MARLTATLALVALLAGCAAAQNLNLNLVTGPGASLTPPSVVGSYKGPIAVSVGGVLICCSAKV